MRPIGIDACAQMVQATAHTGRAKQRSAARWPLQSGFRRARAHCACGRSAFAPKGSVGHLQAANRLDDFVTASANSAWSHARDPRRLSFPLSRLRPLRPPDTRMRESPTRTPAHQNPPNTVGERKAFLRNSGNVVKAANVVKFVLGRNESYKNEEKRLLVHLGIPSLHKFNTFSR